jgi:hypothetical protein
MPQRYALGQQLLQLPPRALPVPCLAHDHEDRVVSCDRAGDDRPARLVDRDTDRVRAARQRLDDEERFAAVDAGDELRNALRRLSSPDACAPPPTPLPTA